MLRPNKYTKVDISLIAIAAEVLKLLQKNKNITYDSLLGKVLLRRGVEAKNVFLPALSFLFVLGKIEYHGKGDVVEYRA